MTPRVLPRCGSRRPIARQRREDPRGEAESEELELNISSLALDKQGNKCAKSHPAHTQRQREKHHGGKADKYPASMTFCSAAATWALRTARWRSRLRNNAEETSLIRPCLAQIQVS